nr:integrase, catalytic region, zinc finger, CCHC-type, peptidase aspartic, catalytic [Tanacetum cinerariifolium]
MSRDVITVGLTMRIPLLYQGEYSQWRERFMNYLEEQTDGEAMINSIQNGDQPLPRVTQVSIAGTSSTEQPHLKDKYMWSDQEKRIQKIDQWKQYVTMMRQNKNLMDINIDALYNILKQNQGDVNDAIGSKKKTVVVISDPLALIAEKTKVSKSKEKVVVSSDSEESEADDFSELKKITALLAKAFNRRKFYSKPTNNNFDSNQEINANMVFMDQIEKVLSDSEASSSSANEKISEIDQICLWIIDSGCSKHMMGNRALLTNIVEKFLETVRFGNKDFAVIAGYGDVVI